MKYLLGIDFGGGASKATLIDTNGKIIADNTVEYPTLYPTENACEQDPRHWIEALCENCKSLIEKYVSPATVIYSEPRFALITEGGSLAFYSKESVNKVLADGIEVPFKQITEGVYTAHIPQSDGDISVTIE